MRALTVATRASSWGEMFASLHQEGHPGLWYVILRCAYAVTHSNLILPIIALAVGTALAYLILRRAPFPYWLRLLTVFGVFISYEFTVMARNYGIGILFLLIACVLFRHRSERGLALGFVLALMANTSVHAALACAMISLLWALDALDAERRSSFLRVKPLLGLAIALSGTALAIWSASPSPDMSYAGQLHNLGIGDIARSVFIDPSRGLKGVYVADIAASAEIPWSRLGLDETIVSRVIVDIGLLAIAWGLWPSRKHFAVFVLSILSFEVLFHGVYPAAIRHMGVVTFLILAICWIAVRDRNESGGLFTRRVAMGLLPVMLIQSIGLPIAARRHIMHPASSSKALGGFIRATPRLSNAILIGEPDYLMEALPYYVPNRIYMPRQHEYSRTVYFARGGRHQVDLTLGGVIDIADSIGCATRSPVLFAIAYPEFPRQPAGMIRGAYNAANFAWTADDKKRLSSRATMLGDFQGATTNENYEVFELPALDAAACASRPGAGQLSR
ncbi:MAG TPA: hypothetical protein VM053_03485 [Gemmatimonadaceae bacterium]|nr:hypothetical protein [Gemmatimonadaceae bacterium]